MCLSPVYTGNQSAAGAVSATKTMGDSNFPDRPALGHLNLIEKTSSRRLGNGSQATSATFLFATMRTEFINSRMPRKF